MTRSFVGMTLKSMTVSQPDSACTVVTSFPSQSVFKTRPQVNPPSKPVAVSAPSAAQKVTADAAAKPEAKPAKNGKCAWDMFHSLGTWSGVMGGISEHAQQKRHLISYINPLVCNG